MDDCLPNLVEFSTELLEDLSSNTLALADKAEQNVLCSDVVVTQLQSFAQREFENLLGAGSKGNVPTWRLRTLADYLNYLGTNRLEADAEAFQAAGSNAFALMNEAEEDVLGAYVVVVKQPCFFLSEYYDSPGSVGESFKHLITSKL